MEIHLKPYYCNYLFSCYFGGMSKISLVNKMVWFEVDGVIIFQGLKTGVIVQLISKHYPFLLGFHYMAHYVILFSRLYHLKHLLQRLKF